MTRVGAVDLGTNSTRLLVADVGDGRLEEVERLLTITRLGDGVDRSGRLADDSIARVHDALDRYAERAVALGAGPVLAVATSAARDARNGADFLAGLERRYGFATRLASGDEEALLTYRGVTSSRPAGAGTLICDIGGGSTELVLGDEAGVGEHVSLNIGCVRLEERFLRSDPPAAHEIAALRRAVTEALPARLVQAARALVGVAGTVTSLATLDLGLEEEIPDRVDAHVLTASAVEALLARLSALPLEDRRRVRGLLPQRARTIVAGAAILAEIVGATGVDAVAVSERDILHGIALKAASLPAR